jgi:hypothetical protein
VLFRSSTAQLARLCSFYGIKTHDRILKYDGRPFSLDDLNSELDRIGAGKTQAGKIEAGRIEA